MAIATFRPITTKFGNMMHFDHFDPFKT